MNTLETLERLKLFTEDWAVEVNRLCGSPRGEAYRLACKAYFDFKSIKVQIEKSLDEMTEGLLKQEQENNK
ncbi:MAG: hypothetical protein V4563_17035, partial [Pseudomonadota bacterium]